MMTTQNRTALTVAAAVLALGPPIGGVMGLIWIGGTGDLLSNLSGFPFKAAAAILGGYVFGGAQAAIAAAFVGLRTRRRGTFTPVDALVGAIIGNLALFAWLWHPLILRGEVLSLKWKTVFFYMAVSMASA